MAFGLLLEAMMGRLSRGLAMGLLPDTLNLGLHMRRECRERFSRHWVQRKPLVSIPGRHHGTCATHVPWCMTGLLNPGWSRKHSRHSRRLRSPQFYVSGKRPMELWLPCVISQETSTNYSILGFVLMRVIWYQYQITKIPPKTKQNRIKQTKTTTTKWTL